jgi:hypothetical protein
MYFVRVSWKKEGGIHLENRLVILKKMTSESEACKKAMSIMKKQYPDLPGDALFFTKKMEFGLQNEVIVKLGETFTN